MCVCVSVRVMAHRFTITIKTKKNVSRENYNVIRFFFFFLMVNWTIFALFIFLFAQLSHSLTMCYYIIVYFKHSKCCFCCRCHCEKKNIYKFSITNFQNICSCVYVKWNNLFFFEKFTLSKYLTTTWKTCKNDINFSKNKIK